MSSGMWNILIVGLGSIGERHLRCFQATGRAVVSACDTNEPVRKKLRQQPGVMVYDGLDVALSDPDNKPHAAVVATPPNRHVLVASTLAEAGIPMLIENPLSTSLDGVSRLAGVVRQKSLLAVVGYQFRLHPALIAMREALVSGRFGKPYQLVASSGQHLPSLRRSYKKTSYADRAAGGGAIQGPVAHLVNVCEWLIGPSEKVMVDAGHQALEGVTVEDTVHLLSRHSSVMCSITLNQHQMASETTITVSAEQGLVRFESHRDRWRWLAYPGDSWHDETVPPQPRDGLLQLQADLFIKALDDQATYAQPGSPLCSLDEGVQTLKASLAALSLAREAPWRSL